MALPSCLDMAANSSFTGWNAGWSSAAAIGNAWSSCRCCVVLAARVMIATRPYPCETVLPVLRCSLLHSIAKTGRVPLKLYSSVIFGFFCFHLLRGLSEGLIPSTFFLPNLRVLLLGASLALTSPFFLPFGILIILTALATGAMRSRVKSVGYCVGGNGKSCDHPAAPT